jgi:hypothetical protein
MKTGVVALVLVGCGGGADEQGHTVSVVLSEAPLAVVAFRDGEGDFATQMPTAGYVSFEATTGNYTIAVGCSSKKTVDVYQGTVEELDIITYDRACLPPPSVTLSGQFSNNNGTSGQVVKWGQDVEFFANFSMPSYTTMLTQGTHDLVATRNAYLADRVVIERQFSASSASTFDVDFAGSQAITLTAQSVVASVGNFGTIANSLLTAGGTLINLSTGTDLAMVMPASSLGSGDFQILEASGQQGLGTNVPVFLTRHVVRTVPTVVSVPPIIAESPEVTSSITNNQMLVAATWPVQGSAVSYQLNVGSWTVHASADAFAVNNLVAIPDLSGVMGWDPMLDLVPPQSIPARFTWTMVAASGGSVDDAWRLLPVRELTLDLSGWSGEDQLE